MKKFFLFAIILTTSCSFIKEQLMGEPHTCHDTQTTKQEITRLKQVIRLFEQQILSNETLIELCKITIRQLQESSALQQKMISTLEKEIDLKKEELNLIKKEYGAKIESQEKKILHLEEKNSHYEQNIQEFKNRLEALKKRIEAQEATQ